MTLFPRGRSVSHSVLIELLPGRRFILKKTEHTVLTFQECTEEGERDAATHAGSNTQTFHLQGLKNLKQERLLSVGQEFYYITCFGDNVSLCSLGWPGTQRSACLCCRIFIYMV